MTTSGSVRSSRSSLNNSAKLGVHQRLWIEKHFFKRECVQFVQATKGGTKCHCGRSVSRHGYVVSMADSGVTEKWQVHKHTALQPTDAFGTLEFQVTHPLKAQYIRLSHDTLPENILSLFTKRWKLELPKLLISVHGGISNFDLQPKLKRVFRKGFLKAAATTSAWVITNGTNTGVTRHVGEALGERSAKAKNTIVSIGIAPWGIVHGREELIGRDEVRPYHAILPPKSHSAVLSCYHSHFLLADNGTIGKYGGEIELRKKLEKFISQQKLSSRHPDTKTGHVPLVCVVLEGGTNTIRTVLQYVTDTPPVPVVVCDGSGRAADLLAFAHKFALDDGTMPDSLHDQLVVTIEKTFQYSQEQAEKLFLELMLCVKKKELITIFRMGEGGVKDIDLAILTALLKGQNASPADQLSLALTWDRVDIARSHIFVYGLEWPKQTLEMAMMDALVNDRVDFVKLLMDNGVSMVNFLTISRLEELYNTKSGPSNTLRYLVRDVRQNMPHSYQYTLVDIGLVIEQLMGGAFRANYCRRRFRTLYYTKKGVNLTTVATDVSFAPNSNGVVTDPVFEFPLPFHDLMVWAVLMKRQKMALFMWKLGEEALSKALVACRLYKAMAREAADDDLAADVSEDLMSYALEFQQKALELLDVCYQQDDDYTEQLLTCELMHWSNQTCLSLAVSAQHRDFLSHTCCQMLLSDMWLGGLRMRKHTTFKVILGILLPPTILALEFKSKEELQLMPQTVEEHYQEIETDSSDSEDSVDCADQEEMEPPHAAYSLQVSDHLHYLMEYFDNPEVSYSRSFSYHPQESGAAGLASSTSFNTTLSAHKKSSPLKIGKKIYEFYAAPITKFWLHAMMYLAFVIVYTYVVLVEMKPGLHPSSPEMFVILYIFTLIIEKVREVISSEPVKLLQKFSVFFSDGWNVLDTIATWMFVVAVALRFQPSTDMHMIGRVMYCLNVMFWYIRLLDLFAVSKHLGPYVTMVFKMIVDMLTFLVILLIVLMSFGVARQAILYPNQAPSWHLVRDVFLEPYFMLYGEVYAGTIDRCGGEDTSGCTPGAWITPLIMSVYLLVANILLINLLIAVFNVTFQKVKPIAKQLWKFQRYNLTIEYEQKPLLPPPLIVFSHLYLIMKYIHRRCKNKAEIYDNGLKLFLSPEDKEKLYDFEEECVEEYFRGKEVQQLSSTEQRIGLTTERVEYMNMRLEDMLQKENRVNLSLQTVDYRLAKLEDLALRTANVLDTIQHYIEPNLGIVSLEDEQPEPPVLSSAGDDQEKFDVSTPPPECNTDMEVTPPTVRRKYAQPAPLVLDEADNLSQKPHKEDSLLERRPGAKGLPPLSLHDPLQVDTSERRVSFGPSHVKHVITESNPGSPQYTSAHNNDKVMVTTAMQSEVVVAVTEKPATDKARRVRTRTISGDHLFRTPSLTSNVSSNNGLAVAPQSAFSSSLSASASAGIASLFPFKMGEYTAITDNIDTSCIQPESPGISPTTPRVGFFPVTDSRLESPERDARINEARILKNAEESEKLQMEGVIRHRLRQISTDDGDNLSDIARSAIAELESDNESIESKVPVCTASLSVVDETGAPCVVIPDTKIAGDSQSACEVETTF